MNSLDTAKAYIRSTLGLSDTPSDWTYAQRISYNNALAVYIANNPDSFSTQSVGTANQVLNENNSPLSDTGFISDLSAFGSAITDEAISAGESIGGIGNGVLSLASATRYLIPIAGVIIIGILLFGFYKKQTT